LGRDAEHDAGETEADDEVGDRDTEQFEGRNQHQQVANAVATSRTTAAATSTERRAKNRPMRRRVVRRRKCQRSAAPAR